MTTKEFLTKYKPILSIRGVEENVGSGKNHIINALNDSQHRNIAVHAKKQMKILFYQMFIDFQKISD